jgi:hypothetical protein
LDFIGGIDCDKRKLDSISCNRDWLFFDKREKSRSYLPRINDGHYCATDLDSGITTENY